MIWRVVWSAEEEKNHIIVVAFWKSTLLLTKVRAMSSMCAPLPPSSRYVLNVRVMWVNGLCITGAIEEENVALILFVCVYVCALELDLL